MTGKGGGSVTWARSRGRDPWLELLDVAHHDAVLGCLVPFEFLSVKRVAMAG
jgi:hypothetical protein